MPRISRDWVAGSILLIVGAFLLAIEFLPEAAYLIPLILGLVLLGVFVIVRAPALLSAGGVVLGVGVGILIARAASPELGGAGVLVSIGGGLLLVWLLGLVFDVPSVRAWPLVPGLALVALGAILYAAGWGRDILVAAIRGWPVALVIVGGYLLLAARLRLPLYGDEEARAEATRERARRAMPVRERQSERASEAGSGEASAMDHDPAGERPARR